MAPVGVGHASIAGHLMEALVKTCADRAMVWVRNPLRLDDFNQPQPDFPVLKRRTDFEPWSGD